MKRLLSISALLAATALAGCGQPAGDTSIQQSASTPEAASTPDATASVVTETAEATYDAETGTYALAWTLSGDAPVTIRATRSRDGTGGDVIAEAVTATSLSWSPEDGERARRYFVVEPDNGTALVTAPRLLPLEGGRNFRDLGGYETADGRRVKWGHVFRSGTMNSLTDADYDYLSDLGIRTVCDFREADERASEPTDWRAGEIEYMTFAPPAGDQDPANNPMFAALMDPDATADQVAASMAAGYHEIALGEAEGYTVMFDELAAGRVPLAFNCSAGKDRAGTAAALILTALGVPRETVVADYSLSDDYVDYMAEFMGPEARAKAEAEGAPYAFLFQLPPEKVAPLMASHPEYIEASLDQLAADHGSVLDFIQTELDVTDEELSAIRTNLLY